jgi:hypothetical protein
MSFQPETKTHETDLRQLRAERRVEDNNLAALKRKLQKLISSQPLCSPRTPTVA